MSKSDAIGLLKVIARSPFELYFEGEADVVSATNRIGNFDILPGHADFFSMLSPGFVIISKADKELASIEASSGIITVRDNEVLVFLNM